MPPTILIKLSVKLLYRVILCQDHCFDGSSEDNCLPQMGRCHRIKAMCTRYLGDPQTELRGAGTKRIENVSPEGICRNLEKLDFTHKSISYLHK